VTTEVRERNDAGTRVPQAAHAPSSRPNAAEPAGSVFTGERVILVLILLLAAALRIHGLGSFALEQDELYTIQEGTELFDTLAQPGISARPLYYLIVHPLLIWLPHTPVLLRLPALIFGIAGVFVAWWLARRTLGRTAGIAAAVFTAISPWHMYASGMARYWSLVFLLAASAYALVPLATDRDDRRLYLATLVVLLLGTSTHPSFLFPVAGAIVAVHLVRTDGTFGFRWPTPTAWRWLWAPYAVFVIGCASLLRFTGRADEIKNWGGRSAAANARIIPAIAEWATPVLCAAAVVGIVLLFRDRELIRRRWALMATFGVGCSLTALVTASKQTNVYADYAMGALPLIMVSAAILPQLANELASRAWQGAAGGYSVLGTAVGLVMVAGILPGTVSHLSDGTRFDYRPAYRWIQATAPSELVVAWPLSAQVRYAPGLRPALLLPDTAALTDTLSRERSFWVVASEKRYGLVGDDAGALSAWLNARCRIAQTTERPRIDDRIYRVVLFRCPGE
jgi:Dolichyl-phosphate-mannose-protein mannosyltransferase